MLVQIVLVGYHITQFFKSKCEGGTLNKLAVFSLKISAVHEQTTDEPFHFKIQKTYHQL